MITKVLDKMLEFQMKNKIIRQCITNTQYLYDTIRYNTNYDVEACAVLCIENGKSKDDMCNIIVHMILISGDEIIDPSHEIVAKDCIYIDNIKTFNEMTKEINITKDGLRNIIKKYLEFVKFADDINNNVCLVANLKFYRDQADYVESALKPKNKNKY